MVRSARKLDSLPRVTAWSMARVTAPLMSVSQEMGRPSSAISPNVMQMGTPRMGTALQHSMAPAVQWFFSIRSCTASLAAAARVTLSSSMEEVSIRPFTSARYSARRSSLPWISSSMRAAMAVGDTGTTVMPNLVAKSPSLAITLIKGTGRAPNLAMRRFFTVFTTAATRMNRSKPRLKSSLSVSQFQM